MPKGRMKLPEDLSGLLTDQWGTIIRQAGYNWEDAEIIRLCFIEKIPQVDAAEGEGNFFEISSCAIPCAKFAFKVCMKL